MDELIIQLNRKLKIEGIVMTMVDFRTVYARDIFEKIHKTYSDSVGTFETYIPISVKAAETSAEGKSIYAHDAHGKAAAAYDALTKEVLGDGRKQEKHKADLAR